MMPTRLELNLAAGKARAERNRLIRLVFAIEDGFEDGTAPAAWRALLSAAHWMADGDEEATP